MRVRYSVSLSSCNMRNSATIGDARADEIQAPKVRQPREGGEPRVARPGAVQIELGHLDEARKIFQPLIGDGRVFEIQFREPGHFRCMAKTMRQRCCGSNRDASAGKRLERIARQARLMQPHFLQARKHDALDHRVFHGNVGLHRLRTNFSSAVDPLKSAIVSATSVAGCPSAPPVQIERLQVRQRWPAESRPSAHAPIDTPTRNRGCECKSRCPAVACRSDIGVRCPCRMTAPPSRRTRSAMTQSADDCCACTAAERWAIRQTQPGPQATKPRRNSLHSWLSGAGAKRMLNRCTRLAASTNLYQPNPA